MTKCVILMQFIMHLHDLLLISDGHIDIELTDGPTVDKNGKIKMISILIRSL